MTGKGIPTGLDWMDGENTVKSTGQENPVSVIHARFAPKWLKIQTIFAVNENQISNSMVSIHRFYAWYLNLLTTMLN